MIYRLIDYLEQLTATERENKRCYAEFVQDPLPAHPSPPKKKGMIWVHLTPGQIALGSEESGLFFHYYIIVIVLSLFQR